MLRQNVAYNREPQTEAGCLADNVAASSETLEDVRDLRSRNAHAAIGDCDHRGLFIGVDVNFYHPAVRTVLGSVRKQIAKYAVEPRGVPVTPYLVLIAGHGELVVRCQRLLKLDCSSQNADEVAMFQVQLQALSGIYSRRVEQFIDEMCHPLCADLHRFVEVGQILCRQVASRGQDSPHDSNGPENDGERIPEVMGY